MLYGVQLLMIYIKLEEESNFNKINQTAINLWHQIINNRNIMNIIVIDLKKLFNKYKKKLEFINKIKKHKVYL